jgi:hypothetical protein
VALELPFRSVELRRANADKWSETFDNASPASARQPVQER